MINSIKLSNEILPCVNPNVSWLICSNSADIYLKMAIDSCLYQTYKDFEIIFVANGKNCFFVANEVQKWFSSDPRIRIFSTHVHHLSFSLTLGIHYARGSLIARMDSDDISKADRLQYQVLFMNDNKDVAVLGTSYEIIDTQGQSVRKVIMPKSNKLIRQKLLYSNPFCHPSVIFRKDVVIEAGGYLGGLHAEDYDLWCRLSLDRSIKFHNLEYIGLGYRVIGVGEARRSRWAYISVAVSQTRVLLNGGGLFWLFSILITVIKLFLKTKHSRL
jgi:cellulose synthase/poly-beta-1,6-N-acetylglucosamine synthase-like glycosyltransferase